MAGQDSHQLLAMAGANSLVVLPDGQGVGAGEVVTVMVTDPERITADQPGRTGLPW
jgi:molybdopterin biosynthesis enzyme